MNEFPLCRTIKPIIIITGGNRSPSAFRGFCALRRWYRQRKKDVLCINMLCLHFYFANILFFVSFMSVCTMSLKKDVRWPWTWHQNWLWAAAFVDRRRTCHDKHFAMETSEISAKYKFNEKKSYCLYAMDYVKANE